MGLVGNKIERGMVCRGGSDAGVLNWRGGGLIGSPARGYPRGGGDGRERDGTRDKFFRRPRTFPGRHLQNKRIYFVGSRGGGYSSSSTLRKKRALWLRLGERRFNRDTEKQKPSKFCFQQKGMYEEGGKS